MGDIERQQVRHLMDMTDSRQPGVMDLFACHTKPFNETERVATLRNSMRICAVM